MTTLPTVSKPVIRLSSSLSEPAQHNANWRERRLRPTAFIADQTVFLGNPRNPEGQRAAEQRRLAYNMHDNFGQLLAAMKIDLGWLAARVENDLPELLKSIDKIAELVDTMLHSVQTIIADLPDQDVRESGLCPALLLLARDFERRHAITMTVDLPSAAPALPERWVTELYRITQEAFTNIVKHAQAQRAHLSLSALPDKLILRIADNGRGLMSAPNCPPNCASKPVSLGLLGMRHRALTIGASFSVQTALEGGTEIVVEIPRINGDFP